MSRLNLPLPTRKRSYRIALAPLADAMFQLLTFFMLTTSLTPYSMLTIGSATNEAGELSADEGLGTSGGQPAVPAGLVIWELEDGLIRFGGSTYQRAQLQDLSEIIAARGENVHVQLVVGPTARVQDVASAMAALRGNAIEKVELKRIGGDL